MRRLPGSPSEKCFPVSRRRGRARNKRAMTPFSAKKTSSRRGGRLGRAAPAETRRRIQHIHTQKANTTRLNNTKSLPFSVAASNCGLFSPAEPRRGKARPSSPRSVLGSLRHKFLREPLALALALSLARSLLCTGRSEASAQRCTLRLRFQPDPVDAALGPDGEPNRRPSRRCWADSMAGRRVTSACAAAAASAKTRKRKEKQPRAPPVSRGHAQKRATQHAEHRRAARAARTTHAWEKKPRRVRARVSKRGTCSAKDG